MGFQLTHTASIPVEVMEVLKKKNPNELASVGLTPGWGQVPALRVGTLRSVGIELPEHWGDNNEVFPMIHGLAFYITFSLPTGMAVSFSMKGVNLRTGDEEQNTLTNNPCQSFWSRRVPYIDGYVPGHAKGVLQFRPLRGEREMAFDISDYVGVKVDNPWKDGISAAWYLPRDLAKLNPPPPYYGNQRYSGNLESYSMKGGSLGLESTTYRGATRSTRSSEPEQVGMGAGALMRQAHPDDPTVRAEDYAASYFLRLTARLVWVDQWNKWASEIDEPRITATKLEEFKSRQQYYERDLWAQIGGRPRSTNVDGFPTLG